MRQTYDKDLSTKRYTIKVDTADNYGFFQNNHNGTEGGLWFQDGHLYDYDGVSCLPREVERALIAAGFTVDDPADVVEDAARELHLAIMTEGAEFPDEAYRIARKYGISQTALEIEYDNLTN